MNLITCYIMRSGRFVYAKEWISKEEAEQKQKIQVTKLYFVIHRGEIIPFDDETIELEFNQIYEARRFTI